jgi:sulfate transport system permease protein
VQVFWHVTLPNIRWGLLYGVILTNARAMGEFGAVSVISGGCGVLGDVAVHAGSSLQWAAALNEWLSAGVTACSSPLSLLASRASCTCVRT